MTRCIRAARWHHGNSAMEAQVNVNKARVINENAWKRFTRTDQVSVEACSLHLIITIHIGTSRRPGSIEQESGQPVVLVSGYSAERRNYRWRNRVWVFLGWAAPANTRGTQARPGYTSRASAISSWREHMGPRKSTRNWTWLVRNERRGQRHRASSPSTVCTDSNLARRPIHWHAAKG